MKKQANKNSFELFLRDRRKRVEKFLNQYLTAKCESKNLNAAMRYAVLNGGKRLRPLLVYAVGEMYGADIKCLDAVACAIEMMHSFSLVHDDLPAMDNDNLRRGKLTCHKAFDEATAVLAGDALSVFAFQIINESKFLSLQQIISMNKVLAKASGLSGMAAGQDLDIQFTGKKLSLKKLEKIYLLKTTSLLQAAVKFGAIAAKIKNQKEIRSLTQFVKNLGLAFQIQDDILNIEGSIRKLGKGIGTDKKRNKITYPELVGMAKTKAKAKHLWHNSEKFLQQLKADSDILHMLVENIKQRDR